MQSEYQNHSKFGWFESKILGFCRAPESSIGGIETRVLLGDVLLRHSCTSQGGSIEGDITAIHRSSVMQTLNNLARKVSQAELAWIGRSPLRSLSSYCNWVLVPQWANSTAARTSRINLRRPSLQQSFFLANLDTKLTLSFIRNSSSRHPSPFHFSSASLYATLATSIY